MVLAKTGKKQSSNSTERELYIHEYIVYASSSPACTLASSGCGVSGRYRTFGKHGLRVGGCRFVAKLLW